MNTSHLFFSLLTIFHLWSSEYSKINMRVKIKKSNQWTGISIVDHNKLFLNGSINLYLRPIEFRFPTSINPQLGHRGARVLTHNNGIMVTSLVFFLVYLLMLFLIHSCWPLSIFYFCNATVCFRTDTTFFTFLQDIN